MTATRVGCSRRLLGHIGLKGSILLHGDPDQFTTDLVIDRCLHQQLPKPEFFLLWATVDLASELVESAWKVCDHIESFLSIRDGIRVVIHPLGLQRGAQFSDRHRHATDDVGDGHGGRRHVDIRRTDFGPFQPARRMAEAMASPRMDSATLS